MDALGFKPVGVLLRGCVILAAIPFHPSSGFSVMSFNTTGRNDAVLQKGMDNILEEAAVLDFSQLEDYRRSRALTQAELKKLKFLFRGVDLTGSMIGEMLQSRTAVEDFRQDMIRSLKKAAESLQIIGLNLMMSSVSKAYTVPAGNDEGGPIDGYEGCRRDYSSVVEPITDRILYLINIVFCEQQPDTCSLLGISDPLPPEKNMTSWGWAMFDARAKMPSGLADGKLHWVGSYEMCHNISADYIYHNSSYGQPGHFVEYRSFGGQYCRLDLQRGNSSLRLQYGVCAPDTCSASDVYHYLMEDNVVLREFLTLLGLNISYVYCGQEVDPSDDAGFKLTAVVCLVFAFLVLIASVYDVFLRKLWLQRRLDFQAEGREQTVGTGSSTDGEAKDGDLKTKAEDSKSIHCASSPQMESAVKPVAGSLPAGSPGWRERLEMAFVGFSAYSNTRRIFTAKDNAEHFDVLNGIRVLNFFWLVLGHTYLLGPVYAECWLTANLIPAAKTLPGQFGFQYVINFHFAADSFLVISGTLTSYWWLKKHEDRKFSYKSVLYYILHRYWRIVPAYMLVIMFYTCTYRYLAKGPMFPPDIQDAENCKTNWWVNLLLMNNLVNKHHQCMSWTWCLAVLFQLHVFSLIVLIPLVAGTSPQVGPSSPSREPAKQGEYREDTEQIQGKYRARLPAVGYALLTAMFVAHIGVTAGVTAQIYNGSRLSSFEDWYFDYLLTPWCRAGPYVVGMALGILLNATGGKLAMKSWIVLIGWLLALISLTVPIYSTYDMLREGGDTWSEGALIAYDTLCRSVFALGVAWVIFACTAGYGGLVTSVLTLKFFQPLSKLVMCTMITHALMILKHYYSQYQLIYISIEEMNYQFFANIWVLFIVGAVVAVLFHYPLSVGLERALLCTSWRGVFVCGRHPLEDAIECGDSQQVAPLSGSGSCRKAYHNNVPKVNNEAPNSKNVVSASAPNLTRVESFVGS